MSEKPAEALAANDTAEALYNEPRDVRWLLRELWRKNHLAVVSLVLILLFILAAVLAPVLTPYDMTTMDLPNRLQAPSWAHPLGTDEAGRDILCRLLYGARVSLSIGVMPTLVSLAVGTALGLLAGYLGGIVDTIIMRVADIVLSFPSILLAMVIMYTLGDGLVNVFLTMVVLGWAGVARIVRAETLSLRTAEYVQAARVIGVRWPTILVRHILPNCAPTLLVLFTLDIPGAILTESSLSFLGMGIQPPAASWGLMVNAGRQFLIFAPWVSFAPCAAIMVVVLAFNYLGDGLRDVLDPHLQQQ